MKPVDQSIARLPRIAAQPGIQASRCRSALWKFRLVHGAPQARTHHDPARAGLGAASRATLCLRPGRNALAMCDASRAITSPATRTPRFRHRACCRTVRARADRTSTRHEEIERLLRRPCNCRLPTACGLGPITPAGLAQRHRHAVGEALRLQLEDVDLDAGLLTVRGTKFGKSRLVPIHPSTREVLASYRERRCRASVRPRRRHFFIIQRRPSLDIGDIQRTFYELSRQIGLRGRDGQPWATPA